MDAKQLMPTNECQTMNANKRMATNGCQRKRFVLKVVENALDLPSKLRQDAGLISWHFYKNTYFPLLGETSGEHILEKQ